MVKHVVLSLNSLAYEIERQSIGFACILKILAGYVERSDDIGQWVVASSALHYLSQTDFFVSRGDVLSVVANELEIIAAQQ